MFQTAGSELLTSLEHKQSDMGLVFLVFSDRKLFCRVITSYITFDPDVTHLSAVNCESHCVTFTPSLSLTHTHMLNESDVCVTV